MLYGTARLHDLVGRHGSITYEHHLVVVRVFMHQVEGRGAFVESPDVVLPHALVHKIVEVEVLEVLELGPRGGKELLTDFHVRIH